MDRYLGAEAVAKGQRPTEPEETIYSIPASAPLVQQLCTALIIGVLQIRSITLTLDADGRILQMFLW
jgi:hypothetical protein